MFNIIVVKTIKKDLVKVQYNKCIIWGAIETFRIAAWDDHCAKCKITAYLLHVKVVLFTQLFT